MKLLKTIEDRYFFQKKKVSKKRLAVRGVFFDDNNMIPVLYVSKKDYYKLPGGGIEKEENRLETLKREAREETGSDVEVLGEVGMIKEFRLKRGLEQVSYCYFGKILKKSEPAFTDEEKSDGFHLIWLSPAEALSKIKRKDVSDYHGSFVQKRDLFFLQESFKIQKFSNIIIDK